MAQSYVSYTGNGSTTDYTVPFLFLSRSHVHILVNGTEVFSGFTWVSDGLIRFSPAVAASVPILIKRVTPMDTRLVQFQNGATLDALQNLDVDSDQLLFIIQELTDLVTVLGLDGQGTGGNHVLFGVGTPSNLLGVDGDLFLATDTHALYQKVTGAFVLKTYVGAVGPAGGDLAGTFPNPTLGNLDFGRTTVVGDLPTANTPALSGVVEKIAGSGTTTFAPGAVDAAISNGAITTAKVADKAITSAKLGALPLSPRSFSARVSGSISWRCMVDIGVSPVSKLVMFGSAGSYAVWDPADGANSIPTQGTITGGAAALTIVSAVYDAVANRIFALASVGTLWSIHPSTFASLQVGSTSYVPGTMCYCSGHNQFVVAINGSNDDLCLFTCSGGSPDAPSRSSYTPQTTFPYIAVGYDAANDIIYALRENDSGGTNAHRLYRIPRSTFNSETHVDTSGDNVTIFVSSLGGPNRLVIAGTVVYTILAPNAQAQYAFDISGGTPVFIAKMTGFFCTAGTNQGLYGVYLGGYLFIATGSTSSGVRSAFKLDPTVTAANKHPIGVAFCPIYSSPNGATAGASIVEMITGNDGFIYIFIVDTNNCFIQLNP